MAQQFGSMFEGVGSVVQDLLLKTRGNIKVQCGAKFIDLVKGGEIVVPDKNLFETVESTDEIKESGIYLCEKNVYFKIGDILIKINGEIIEQ